MTTATPEVIEQPSYLDMSDEELMNMGSAPALVAEPASVEPVEVVEAPVAEEPVVVEPTKEEVPAVVEPTQEDPEVKAPVVEPVKAEPVVEKTTPVEPVAVDYKAEYDKIFAPFKANGKDIAVASAEDAISLMQMGANYNKKMAALKPNLKLMKLLENSGLLSEEKISYLIDLENKNPEAISKLVKDSGLDHMDLDAEKASAYKPKTYTVDDREMELDAVLDEIQGTPSYNRTLDIVSTKWDGPSKQVIAASPQLLKVINSHIQNGIYDTIIAEVDRERMFGRLNGMSDIEAYRHVGDAIQERGGFNPVATPGKPTTAPVIVPPKPDTAAEDRLREKRRAASSTKPAGSGSAVADFNPLAMSDEEFSKSVNSKYL
jgi:hypothetical protein